MIGVGQEFASLFGSSVGRDGVVNVFFFGEEGALGPAVDTAGGGEDKVLNTNLCDNSIKCVVPRIFE